VILKYGAAKERETYMKTLLLKLYPPCLTSEPTEYQLSTVSTQNNMQFTARERINKHRTSSRTEEHAQLFLNA
jgi:hypothetical protein